MPVLVEAIAAPSAQDLADLAAPHADAAALVEAALAEGSLIAGRFNDRLLGAALLRRGEPAWQLSHLCVRKVTRRRGVARRLIEEARRLAAQAGRPLQLAAPEGHLEAQALASRMHLPLAHLPPG